MKERNFDDKSNDSDVIGAAGGEETMTMIKMIDGGSLRFMLLSIVWIRGRRDDFQFPHSHRCRYGCF